MRVLSPSLALAAALLASGPVAAAPMDFTVQVGHAVLCLSHVEPGYFYNYLAAAFGPPYKREGGAYWFRTPGAKLWESSAEEVFVSDGSSAYAFIGVLTPTPPQDLATALAASAPAGVGFAEITPGQRYSPWRSRAGSVIAYQGTGGKVYCNGVSAEAIARGSTPFRR